MPSSPALLHRCYTFVTSILMYTSLNILNYFVHAAVAVTLHLEAVLLPHVDIVISKPLIT